MTSHKERELACHAGTDKLGEYDTAAALATEAVHEKKSEEKILCSESEPSAATTGGQIDDGEKNTELSNAQVEHVTTSPSLETTSRPTEQNMNRTLEAPDTVSPDIHPSGGKRLSNEDEQISESLQAEEASETVREYADPEARPDTDHDQSSIADVAEVTPITESNPKN
ncbi:hypothetical protein CONLIGDRAFT_680162 [Coniochaeta ligniaria NRRL 30616]|uniref:Uncharacterized protein n=1 Tax=Coniochaeta ligniaria NRRL 30616 TaxID=1408157 RepID=A0A1J7J7Q3_9PEZI|nr:hypothetical protein CONLIGDRAFT_680162 [Coniochaeta ligniaria NRRL 30616]